MTTTGPRAILDEIKARAEEYRSTMDIEVAHDWAGEAVNDTFDAVAALTAVLDELDRLENKNVQNSLTLGEADPGRSTFSDGHQIGIHKGRIEATARIHEVITDALSGQP